MSDSLQVVINDIYSVRESFDSVLVDKSISFDKEANFAVQILSANQYALKLATENRQSVIDAVTNIAAIGISLNPASKQAYLVPRDRKICLDISYIGLMDLAVQSGSIRWGQARTVHTFDVFKLCGLDKQPIHEFQPFGDRGDIIGVYVTVKTADGDYLTECMSTADVNEIRDRSSAWRVWIDKQKKCPWVTDWAEMAKKTVVKRAYKYWPKTERLDQAVQYLNTDGGEGMGDIQARQEVPQFSVDSILKQIDACQTEAELVDMWKPAVKRCNEAKDRVAYERIKTHWIRRRNSMTVIDADGGGIQ